MIHRVMECGRGGWDKILLKFAGLQSRALIYESMQQLIDQIVDKVYGWLMIVWAGEQEEEDVAGQWMLQEGYQ